MIVLPWPDTRLTPNAKRRTHWRVYQPAIKAARHEAAVLTTCALSLTQKRAVAASEGKIPVTITFFPPDRRHRDDDGMVGSFKHYRDGIADALGVDDRRFAPHYFFAEAKKPGRVEVTFPAIHRLPNASPQEGFCTDSRGLVTERAGSSANCQPDPDHNTCNGGANGSRSQ